MIDPELSYTARLSCTAQHTQAIHIYIHIHYALCLHDDLVDDLRVRDEEASGCIDCDTPCPTEGRIRGRAPIPRVGRLGLAQKEAACHR